MITYERALEIARELKADIDHCQECSDGYIFTAKADEWSIGGDGPCCVLKENGRAVNMTEYIDNYKADVIKEFDIK